MLYLGLLLISLGIYFIVKMKKGLKLLKDNDIKSYYLFSITLGVFFVVVGIFSILNFFMF